MSEQTTTNTSQGNKGNNNRNFKGKKKFHGNNRNHNNNKREHFKGECDDLKGNVYYIGSAKEADNFNNTTEKILSYIIQTYEYGEDVEGALKKLEDINFDELKPKKK